MRRGARLPDPDHPSAAKNRERAALDEIADLRGLDEPFGLKPFQHRKPDCLRLAKRQRSGA